MTRRAFPLFTAFSVENSPLAVFPALVASPIRFRIFCLLSKLFHLLFQCLVHLFRNCHLKGTLQSLALHCFFEAVPWTDRCTRRVRSCVRSHPQQIPLPVFSVYGSFLFCFSFHRSRYTVSAEISSHSPITRSLPILYFLIRTRYCCLNNRQ